MPTKLKFLTSKTNFIKDYEKEPSASIFEALNLELISNLFHVKIVLYSIFDRNHVLFSSVFNNQYLKKIEMIAVVENDNIYYGTVFQKDHLEKIHAGRKVGSPDNNKNSILEDAEENESKLKTLDDSTTASDDLPVSFKSASSGANDKKLKFLGKDGSAYHKYDELFG